MARPERITKTFLVQGMQAGKTTEDMAKELGVHPNSITNKKRTLGLTAPLLDHKWAVPWVLNKKDKHSTEYQYLVALSTAAQTNNFQGSIVRAAAQWALGLIEKGMDITYVHAWQEVYVGIGLDVYSHLKMVLQAALDGEVPEPH